MLRVSESLLTYSVPMIWFTIALLAVVTLIYLHYTGERNIRNVPPGPPRLPIIGSVAAMALSPHRKKPYLMFRDLCSKYGPIVFMKLGVRCQVITDDYETIRDILNHDAWTDRVYNDWIALRAFGKKLGVLLVGGDVWKEMRRFSLRTLRDFGFGKQSSMDATIQEELTELMADINAKLNDTTSGVGVVVPMHQFFTISVLNILWKMIAGFRFDHNDKRLKQLLILIDQVTKDNSIGDPVGALYIAFPSLRHILPKVTRAGVTRAKMVKMIHDFFREFLEERRATGVYREDTRDFMDAFLTEIDSHAHLGKDESVNHYTDEQFMVLVQDLFLAGSETTANSMEFAVLYMMLHPEVQQRVQAEIDQVVGPNRTPCITDKPNMPYTEATLLEVQRMANVVPVIVRSPVTDTTIGKYNIPEGTIGIFNLYSMHMNPKTFPSPHEFNPNRFYDADSNSVVNANKILPFGTGKRVCLGEVLARTTLFTYFTTFMQQYSFSMPIPAPGSPASLMEAVPGFTLSPKPYSVCIRSRLL